MVIYHTLGVATVINACGTVTRLSGGRMAPEVLAAMNEAAQASVDMVALQAGACRAIRAATGAEAGIVTAGAQAAVLLGAAACLAGLDPVRINALPEVADGRCEFVVVRSQRNMYDRALRTAGGRIVEVGIPDRHSGPGVRDAAPWEVAAAIGRATAGVYYLAGPQSRPALCDVAAAAHEAGVPVLVDAAAQLPPADNLRRFIAEGADLVCFSGGKALGGPQASGILAGRADLVASALLQSLDLDLYDDLWAPPVEFAALDQLPGLPHHGIGRACKVGKEEIAGLCAALARFVADDPQVRRERWLAVLAALREAAAPVALRPLAGEVPQLLLDCGGAAAARELARRLAAGTPAILCAPGRRDEGVLGFNPAALSVDEARIVGRRLKELAG